MTYIIRTEGVNRWGSVVVRGGCYHIVDHTAADLEAQFQTDA